MYKYSIDLSFVDYDGLETNTTLIEITYIEVLETDALMSALEYFGLQIKIHMFNTQSAWISIEEFFFYKSVNKFTKNVSRNL